MIPLLDEYAICKMRNSIAGHYNKAITLSPYLSLWMTMEEIDILQRIPEYKLMSFVKASMADRKPDPGILESQEKLCGKTLYRVEIEKK